MENDLSGRGNAPNGKHSSLCESRFDWTARAFFDEEPVGGIVEAEDPGNVHGFYRHLGESPAFFAVFLLADFVRRSVGSGHRDRFYPPRVRFEPARAFVQISVESEDGAGFAQGENCAASCRKGRNREVGILRIRVRVFEFVDEGARNGYRARGGQRFVAVFGFSEFVSGNLRANDKAFGGGLGNGLHGDERAGRGDFRGNVDLLPHFRLEHESACPRRNRSVGNVGVLSSEDVHGIVPERRDEDFGSEPVDVFVTCRDGENRERLDRRSRGEKDFLIHSMRGYSEMDFSIFLRRRSIRNPTVTKRTPQKMKKSALSIMSKNQSKYFAKTKTVTAAKERFTVNESFFAIPEAMPAMVRATK